MSPGLSRCSRWSSRLTLMSLVMCCTQHLQTMEELAGWRHKIVTSGLSNHHERGLWSSIGLTSLQLHQGFLRRKLRSQKGRQEAPQLHPHHSRI